MFEVTPSRAILIYEDADGNLHEQLACDLTEVGTLIDPDTGEDMDLVAVRVEA